MSVGGGAARLVLPHLAKDDEGLYTLRIFTKDGTAEHSAYLFVSGSVPTLSPSVLFDHSSSDFVFLFICCTDAAPSAAGAPGAPMSVKAYDINSDYVLVAWKPPNTVNEASITGYFVDKSVCVHESTLVLMSCPDKRLQSNNFQRATMCIHSCNRMSSNSPEPSCDRSLRPHIDHCCFHSNGCSATCREVERHNTPLERHFYVRQTNRTIQNVMFDQQKWLQ